uniref:Gtp-binding protein lepa n=1 Tax=Tetraselmis sp. GSL018 TaxID=582737 RepID=A0A061RAU5_9CHLO|mmetsp:Transcript_11757/g.27919  ORF Transcript_11757/g.27919 Transcript_11757/m.27919 type:complete len:151 (+) Transcript_11757:132-584(+)
MANEKPVKEAKFAVEGGPRLAPRRVPPAGFASLTFQQKQQVDYIRTATRKNVWYYRDRLNVARGPCSLPVLRECWVQGVIDENTLVWGQGLGDWIPARNVRTLVAQIRTVEVQVATWIKREFALKPALEKVRKSRGDLRQHQSSQVEEMY